MIDGKSASVAGRSEDLAREVDPEPGAEFFGVGQSAPHTRARGVDDDAPLDAVGFGCGGGGHMRSPDASYMQYIGCITDREKNATKTLHDRQHYGACLARRLAVLGIRSMACAASAACYLMVGEWYFQAPLANSPSRILKAAPTLRTWLSEVRPLGRTPQIHGL